MRIRDPFVVNVACGDKTDGLPCLLPPGHAEDYHVVTIAKWPLDPPPVQAKIRVRYRKWSVLR